MRKAKNGVHIQKRSLLVGVASADSGAIYDLRIIRIIAEELEPTEETL